MKKTSKFISIVSISLTGLALSIGALAGVFKNRAVETKALFTPSTTYNVSDTQEELASYYSSIGSGDTGDTLLGKLRSLNSSKYHKNFSYSNFGTSSSTSPYVYTDYPLGTTTTDSNGQVRGSAIASFYTKTTSTSYNKEHVWPDSKGGNKVENDILMPRPTISSENSSRGNSNFVEGMNSSSGGWDPFTAGYDKACRGECARIMLYCVVASSNLSLVAGNSGSSSSCGDMNTLIKWHFDYSPSTYEMNRNNGAEYLQGNRNPFVDHPEYVAKIWSNFNNTVSSICNNKSSMYNEWVPGSCSNYGTNDAAGEVSPGGEGGGSGEQGGGDSGEQGGGNVGDIVVDNKQVENGDKVVLRTQESNPKGVSGFNGTKDATISTKESEWKEFAVTNATSSGFKLKDETANQFIGAPGGNEFKYDSSGGTCSVDDEGRLMCGGRYLCVNGTNYRFYTSYGSYPTFYVYLKSTTSGTSGEEEVTSISASVSKIYYVGETISSSDITVKDNSNNTITSFTFANNGYQFKYEDAASGGASTNKTFTNSISAENLSCSLTVQVQRKARSSTESVTKSVSYTDLPTAYSTDTTARTAASGIKFIAYNLANYSSKMQFRATGGYFQTAEPLELHNLTINNRESNALTVYGSNDPSSFEQSISGTDDTYNLTGYSYVRVKRNGSNAAYCSSIDIVIGDGSDNAINLAHYIMYTDTNNQCVTKLPIAMGYLKDLPSTEKSTFKTSNDYVIKTARTRLEAWALNQEKTIDYDTGDLHNRSNLISYGTQANDSTIIVIIVVTTLSISSLSITLVLKKKRKRSI